ACACPLHRRSPSPVNGGGSRSWPAATPDPPLRSGGGGPCEAWWRGCERERTAASSLRLVLVAHEVQRTRRDALQFAPARQRLLAAMRDPHLAGTGVGDRLRELVPVRMVGDDQRQFDPALPRPLADRKRVV